MNTQSSVPVRSFFHADGYYAVCQVLVLMNIISMTRAFALSALIETLLWAFFLFYRPLRREFLDTFYDQRVRWVFLFWSWILLSCLWSEATWFLRFEEVWSWRKLLLLPMCIVLFKDDRLKNIAVIVLLSIASVYMVFSWLGFLGLVELDREPSHLLENHSTQGVVFSVCCFLALTIFKRNTSPLWVKLAVSLMFLGMVSNIIIILTGRSGFLALALLAPWAVYVFLDRHKLLGAVITLLILSVGLYQSPRASTKLADGLSAMEATAQGRLDKVTSMGLRYVFWVNSIQMIMERPVLGTGSGGFKDGYQKTISDASGWRATPTDDPHQQYLLIAGEHGLIGLGIFLVALFLISISSTSVAYRVGILGLLAATAANGFFNGHFNSFVEGRLYWMMTGILLSGSTQISDWADVKLLTARFLLRK